jgi:CxxC motif-containing protein (DUF1111 family)
MSIASRSGFVRLAGPLTLVLTFVGAPAHARFGAPLPGLTDAELAEYKEGFFDFRAQIFTAQGLGPAFNAVRCYTCHAHPALGGQTIKIVTRFGRVDSNGFDPLDGEGGTILQSKGITAACTEVVPADANIVTKRNTSSALGDGLVEAIPDQQILDRVAAEQAENAAAAGRPHMVTGVSDGQTHVGRFGWKAQRGLLIDAVGEAMLNELGFTNALFPTETAPNGDAALLAQCDSVPDPEDTTDFLHKLTNVLRFTTPPAPRAHPNQVAILGEQVFHSTGCAFCHYDGYTSASSNPALDGKSVVLYSDLLLHDIGTGDGIVQGDAQGNEFRTAPLWLERGSFPYLHDGRARTVAEAIEAHQGQALDARNAYDALSAIEQKALLRFLLQ